MSQRTPDFVGIRTPNRHLNESFGIAQRLVDDLREAARNHHGRDGYIAVSDGQYNRCHSWDPRDYDHINKMAAYLWGMEPELDRQVSDNIFADQLDPVDGHYRIVYRQDQRGIHLGQYAKFAAERFRYAAHAEHLLPYWTAAVRFVRWAYAAYDALDSGLIDQISAQATGDQCLQTFWAFFIGEPEHFPLNHSPYSKPVGVGMTFCALLSAMARFGATHDLPDTDYVAARAARLREILETQAYNETRGYYYLQYDAFNEQWYFSVNGTCEQSRELFITPYYADEVCALPERARSVARVVNQVLHDHHCFPMPITYPSYRWYGGTTACHFHAFGMDRFLFRGCWDSPYASCMGLLSKVGLIESLTEAVRRRSEAICRDQDCLEWYYPDGSSGETGTGESFHRDRYGIAATAHLSALIEGLFGIRPLSPGFEEIRIAPAFPYCRDPASWPTRPGAPPFTGWRHSTTNNWLDTDVGLSITLPGGRHLDWTCHRDTAANQIRLSSNPVDVTAHLRLPVEEQLQVTSVQQAGQNLDYRLEQEMDTLFLHFACRLDGAGVVVQMAPRDRG
ncbi:MAG: hypothetical protein IT369_20915 [Candidatus Latescibacteria bacterium]|nr:hypothetical protein [Candidatus Latescibacterota bacterium]